MTVLAIDYGTKRIGLAISRVGFAEPLVVLENSIDIFTRLKEIINEENVDKIILGLSENEMAEKTKEFGDRLKSETNLSLEYTDETLSSKNVKEKIKVLKKNVRSGPIDHFAAAEFLQEWLDINFA